MATLLFTNSVIDQYKEISELINSVNNEPAKVVKKTSLKAMMQQSFFHGANKFGSNFIA